MHTLFLVHTNTSLETCLNLCQESAQCLGYSFSLANGSCGLYSGFERFEMMDGLLSGRKCTNCELREWVKVRRELSKLISRLSICIICDRLWVQFSIQFMTSVLMTVSISVDTNLLVPISTFSTVKSRPILGLSALLSTQKEPAMLHLSTLIMFRGPHNIK